jgi:hypothetical protein
MQNIFGAGSLWGTPLADATGAAIAVPSPVQFGLSQEISIDMSFDSKLLYGQNQFPVAVGRGKGKVSGKIKNAQVNGALWNSIFFGQTLNSNAIGIVQDTTGIAIPATPFTITAGTTSDATHIKIPNTGTWSADLGVRNANGVELTRVASGPMTGQYTVAAGVYVFAAADVGTTVFINYEYTYTSAVAKQSTVNNLPMGYAPSFRADILMPYAGKSAVFTFYSCLASKLSLATKLDDFVIPEIDFDCFADATGRVFTWSLSE